MFVCYECCVLSVQFSASGWSLVQRGPTDCGVSECYRETSQRGHRPTRGLLCYGQKMANWKLIGSKRPWPTRFTVPQIFWRECGKLQNPSACFTNEIRAGDLPNQIKHPVFVSAVTGYQFKPWTRFHSTVVTYSQTNNHSCSSS